jgi:hypothetical protein
MITKNPSIFTFENTETGVAMSVDLAKITLVSKRSECVGGYYINLGGNSIPAPTEAGEAILKAWLAFGGKFIPGQTT